MKTKSTDAEPQQELLRNDQPVIELSKDDDGYFHIWVHECSGADSTAVLIASGKTKHAACSEALKKLKALADRANELCGYSEKLLEAEVKTRDSKMSN